MHVLLTLDLYDWLGLVLAVLAILTFLIHLLGD